MTPQRRMLLSWTIAALAIVGYASPARTDERPLPRVGILLPYSSPVERQVREQLAARGYADGKTVKIDWRHYKSWDVTMRVMSEDLVRSAPDLIVVFGTPPAREVLKATTSIPVVFVAGDPVPTGLVSSLSRPGGNATGVSVNAVQLSTKLLDILMQLVPKARRVVAVRNPLNPLSLQMVQQVQYLAPALRVEVLAVDARDAHELAQRLGGIDKRGADAILVPPDLVFQMDKEHIVRAVRRTGLPAIYQQHAFAEAGGLVSYAPDPKEIGRSVAGLVEKILNGANTADLPVEEVSRFGL